MNKILRLSSFKENALLVVLSLLPMCVSAGTFVSKPWNGDSDTGLDPVRTQWAYSFGSNQSTVINGVTVRGIEGAAPANEGSFTFTGSAATSIDDTNELYGQGDGSATVASYFVFGGSSRQITLQGLYPGVEYTVTLFLVGFLDETAGVRTATVSSGSDSLLVDQSQYGGGEGYRLDYTFVATGAEREIDFTATNAGATLHLYGLALRKEPIVVTSSSDNLAVAGILRFAIDDAPAGSLITFDPLLGNQVIVDNTINLQNGNFLISKDLTIDASEVVNRFGFPIGMTISAGSSSRVFVASKDGDEVDISTATGSTATQSSESSDGSFPASNAIDGNLSTHSESGTPDSIVVPGEVLAPSLTVNLGRDVLLGSLKLKNYLGNRARLRNITVELFDGRGVRLWESGLLGPDENDFGPEYGPNELPVVFPPCRVFQIKITGKESPVVPRLSIAEIQAFAPAVTLRSLTIRNGEDSSGGGISNTGLLSLENCKFVNNTATTGVGGAIDNSGDLAIVGTEFSGNSAGYVSTSEDLYYYGGGAISSIEGANLAVHGSRFVGNSAAGSGGAISAVNVESLNNLTEIQEHKSMALTVKDCEFEGNSASATDSYLAGGGAIMASFYPFSIEGCRLVNNFALQNGGAVSTGAPDTLTAVLDCEFEGNQAEDGGAVSSSELLLTRCRLQGNTASARGGAVFGFIEGENSLFAGNAASSGGALYLFGFNSVLNCSLLGNAADQGGALVSDTTASLGGPVGGVGFTNTLLWGNESGGSTAGAAVITLDTAGVFYSHCLSEGVNLVSQGTGNLDGTLATNDPQLVSPVPFRGTLTSTTAGGPRVTPFSPLLGAGAIVSQYPQTDLEGDPREVNGIDIGAVEIQDTSIELSYTFDADPDQDGYPIGLEFAIGSDPYLADWNHPARLRVELEPRENLVPLARYSFGVVDEYQSQIVLRLKGSLNGMASFSTFRSNETTNFANEEETYSRAASGAEFFQLEAELRD